MTTKKITKAEFGWIVEIVRAGEIVRRFECATKGQIKECEQEKYVICNQTKLDRMG